jgi:hypothetical protein
MTDQITRARKEWCEPPVSETTITHYGTKIITTPKGSQCPPSIVSALLDVHTAIDELIDTAYGRRDFCPLCDNPNTRTCTNNCTLKFLDEAHSAAKAAITRALEQKP